MLVRVVEHDPRPVMAIPWPARVPQRVMEQHSAAGRRADLYRAGKQILALKIGRIRLACGLMAAWNDAEVPAPRLHHVCEVIADLQLEKRNRPILCPEEAI